MLKMIPKKLHQIWVGDIPERIEKNILETKKLFEANNWEYKLWTYDDLIKEQIITSSLYKLITTYTKPIELAYAKISDIARYKIIKKYGGFYADTDTIFVKIIPDEFLNKDFIAGYGDEFKIRNRKLIINGFFGAKERHFILDIILNVINKYSLNNLVKTKPWKVTGPFIFTNIVETYALTEENILVLPEEYFCPFKNGENIDLSKITDKTICYTYWNNNNYLKNERKNN